MGIVGPYGGAVRWGRTWGRTNSDISLGDDVLVNEVLVRFDAVNLFVNVLLMFCFFV